LNVTKQTTLFFLLLVLPVYLVPAQTTNSSTTGSSTTGSYFDLSGSPQWVRDLRRWEIVAFGSIPFAMFTTTFGMDLYRWNKANGMDWSDSGRRYAPWPLKSAGAITMDSDEMKRTLIISGGLCITAACVDLVITQIRRAVAKKRAATLPQSATVITKRPLPEEAPAETPAEENPGGAAESPEPPPSAPTH